MKSEEDEVLRHVYHIWHWKVL